MDQADAIFLGIDHVTIPVTDVEVAERFYTGVMGGTVIAKFDEAFIEAVRPGQPVDPQSLHTCLMFGGGPHLDLFCQRNGQPPAYRGHPHIAIAVRPDALLGVRQRLNDHGVPTQGANRLGPPGHASVYFNDPFGNHLEFQTLGFAGDVTMGPPDPSALTYQWAG